MKLFLTFSAKPYYYVMAFSNSAVATTDTKGVKEKNMNNQTTFEVKEPKAKATIGQIRRICSQFHTTGSPKDIKWGTIYGHFLARLNSKQGLNQGEVSKILSMKKLPSADIKAMQSYKKLVSLG